MFLVFGAMSSKVYSLSILTKPTEQNCKDTGGSYLVTVFNFMYFSFLAPFKIIEDPDNPGEYCLRKNGFQRVACAITHFIALAELFPFAMKYLQEGIFSSGDISDMVRIVGHFATSVGVLVTIKVLWWEQEKLVRFCNMSRIPPSPNSRRRKLHIIGICLYMHVTHVIYWYCSPDIKPVVVATRNRIQECIWVISDSLSIPPEDFQNSCVVKAFSTLLICFLLLVGFFSTALFAFSRLLIMAIALKFRILGKQFESRVAGETAVKNVVRIFDEIKGIVDCGNSWISGIVLAQYVALLSFLAYIPALVKTEMAFGGGEWYMSFTYFVFGYYIVAACDMPSRIKYSWINWMVKRRLEEDFSVEDKVLMVSLTQQIESEPIGVSCVFFSLTFSFLGSMFGVLATYSILVFQVR